MTRDELIEDNIKLIYYIREKYYKDSSETLKEELFGEGQIGLVYAANTFDQSKECKFSTYACSCILNKMRTFIRNQCTLDKSKANTNTYSLEEMVENEYFPNLCKYNYDYDEKLRVEEILKRVEKLNIKNAVFVCKKVSEGYMYKDIGDMLNISGDNARNVMRKVRNKIRR